MATGTGHWPFWTPNPDLEGPGPCPSGARVTHIEGLVGKIKVVGDHPNSYCVRMDTPYPDPEVKGSQKVVTVGFWSLTEGPGL